MKLLYTHEQRLMVENIKNLLEPLGFELVIKNEYANGGIGELAIFDCWPELWLSNENDYPAAIRAINNLLKNDDNVWVCTKCKETNYDSFELCWQCGAERSLIKT